ncbi:MAG: FtsK/SpoIIIE domain-containing protein, partial [Anaerolineae bacterium]
MNEVAQDFQHKIVKIRPAFAEFTRQVDPLVPEWTDQVWGEWTPATTISPITRLGELKVGIHQDRLPLPALLSFPGRRNLLLKTAGPAKATAVQSLQSLLLRLAAMIPPGKLRFTFIDPVGLGQNVAAFMHLADYDEKLVTNRAWTEPHHIEQRLADLTEHMETVIQTYLRNQYATIEDYNEHAGEIAEPYRVLVVLDFPVNFSETAARRLVSIAQNGPRCGVYTVVLVDTEKPLPHGFNLADLERASTVIAWNGERFVWEDDDFQDCLLELDNPPDADLFNRILTSVGEAAAEASRVEVPFERVAPPPARWWTEDSRDGLQAPLGPAGARRIQHLTLGHGTAQHALVVGRTGSGKSTLLHVLITNLALAYRPEEVELYLVDFKKGVEFKTYATNELPHARVVAIESEREFGLSVLQGLDAEIKRRGDLFRAAGVDHIADYRTKMSKGAEEQGSRGEFSSAPRLPRTPALLLPRILLIVDEFQEFFTEDDVVASQASQVLDRLVRQGRAFGVHVLLGSQTLAGAYTLARSTIGQMAVRIALQCSEADS